MSSSAAGRLCTGYNITEFTDTREKLDQAEASLDELSFIQSHGVRKPLVNELDQVIKEISDKGEHH